jgi:hypothetical protein
LKWLAGISSTFAKTSSATGNAKQRAGITYVRCVVNSKQAVMKLLKKLAKLKTTRLLNPLKPKKLSPIRMNPNGAFSTVLILFVI